MASLSALRSFVGRRFFHAVLQWFYVQIATQLSCEPLLAFAALPSVRPSAMLVLHKHRPSHRAIGAISSSAVSPHTVWLLFHSCLKPVSPRAHGASRYRLTHERKLIARLRCKRSSAIRCDTVLTALQVEVSRRNAVEVCARAGTLHSIFRNRTYRKNAFASC